MSARDWPQQHRWNGSAVTGVHEIICGAPGCTTTEQVFNLRCGSKTAGEVLSKRFRALGWEVGDRPKHDRCPACVALARTVKKIARAAGASARVESTVADQGESLREGTHEHTHEEDHDMPDHKTPSPPDERRPSRIQSRAIMDALDTHYPRSEQGYSGDMTDAKLAAQLNVPRVWVTEVRERFYGPEFVVDVHTYDRRLSLLEDIYKEFEARMLEEASAISKQLAAARRELDAIRGKLTASAS